MAIRIRPLLLLLVPCALARRGPFPMARIVPADAVASTNADVALVKSEELEEERKMWSPLLSAARATYERSPLLSLVRAAGPQAAVFTSAFSLCVERFRRHVTPATAAMAALAVLPAPAQRAAIKCGAATGFGVALVATVREARLEQRAAPLEGEPFALVTGCGDELGASAAEALARRGYGVALVSAREGDAKALARRLRADYGARCVAIGCPGLADDARGSVRSLYKKLREANVSESLDVLIHAPSERFLALPAAAKRAAPPEADAPAEAPPADAAAAAADSKPAPAAFDEGRKASRDALSVADVALQARCRAATHLARRVGGDMAKRGRGRCCFVVGLEDDKWRDFDEPPEAFDSTGAAIRASDAFTESLAKDLRRSLAKFGVGVTLARRRERPPPLAWLRAKRKQEPDDVAADGDRLVAAILRGDAHVSLHAEPTWHDLD